MTCRRPSSPESVNTSMIVRMPYSVRRETIPTEERVANRLRKGRQWLFTFLDHPGVEATNNRAERALRPAVIARKLSCGNKTERGKRTWEILASLAATCHQRGQDLTQHLRPYLILPQAAQHSGR